MCSSLVIANIKYTELPFLDHPQKAGDMVTWI